MTPHKAHSRVGDARKRLQRPVRRPQPAVLGRVLDDALQRVLRQTTKQNNRANCVTSRDDACSGAYVRERDSEELGVPDLHARALVLGLALRKGVFDKLLQLRRPLPRRALLFLARNDTASLLARKPPVLTHAITPSVLTHTTAPSVPAYGAQHRQDRLVRPLSGIAQRATTRLSALKNNTSISSAELRSLS